MGEEEKGIRIYNPNYSRSLIDAKASEAGFPVAFQGEQFDKFMKLLFDLRLCICKVYDEESWRQIQSAWREGRHFHMIPRWKQPEIVPQTVPAAVPVSAPVPDQITDKELAQAKEATPCTSST